jgi:hypothetical protein
MKETKVYEATGGKLILWWQTKENGAERNKEQRLFRTES